MYDVLSLFLFYVGLLAVIVIAVLLIDVLHCQMGERETCWLCELARRMGR